MLQKLTPPRDHLWHVACGMTVFILTPMPMPLKRLLALTAITVNAGVIERVVISESQIWAFAKSRTRLGTCFVKCHLDALASLAMVVAVVKQNADRTQLPLVSDPAFQAAVRAEEVTVHIAAFRAPWRAATCHARVCCPMIMIARDIAWRRRRHGQ